jgi:Right handed beta helix region
MSAQSISAAGTAASAPHALRARSPARLAAAILFGAGSLAMALGTVFPPLASASTQPAGKSAVARANCAAAPSKCGYPDRASTGVPRGTTLRSVPGQVSSGRGWHFDSQSRAVDVTGKGAVLSGLYIRHALDIEASDVTVKNVYVVTGGYFGVSMRHTTGVTIENCTIRGRNTGRGRVSYAITDLFANSTGMTIRNNNISRAKTAVQLTTGLVAGNYIHDFGYVRGDHTNGIFDDGTTQHLTIRRNTILNNLSQTDAISLDASVTGRKVAHKTVENNLLGGGSYAIYGGDARHAATSHVVIANNRFSQAYYSKGGRYGPVAYYASRGRGNTWTGNTWDATGQPVPAP